MNFINSRASLLFALLFSIVVSNAQTYKYEIIAKGKKVGIIEGSFLRKDSIIEVNISALGEIHFIITEHVQYKLSALYKNRVLLFSSATIFLNGKAHFSSIVKKEGDYYIIDKNEHKSTFSGSIKYSGALLYFIEPEKFTKIFSEIDNIEKDISKVGEHTYKIVNPATEKASFFTYEKGILKTADIHHSYIDFKINRIQ